MKNQNKIYIIVTIIILIILILIMFLIYPALKDIKSISEQILLYKQQVISINGQNREFDNFKKRYDNYGYNLEKVDKLFVNSKDPVDFIQFLEKTARDSGISNDIKLDVSLLSKGFNSWPVINSNIYATGEFLNILKFFEKLDTGPYLMRIKNVTIKKSRQEPLVEVTFLVEAITK